MPGACTSHKDVFHDRQQTFVFSLWKCSCVLTRPLAGMFVLGCVSWVSGGRCSSGSFIFPTRLRMPSEVFLTNVFVVLYDACVILFSLFDNGPLCFSVATDVETGAHTNPNLHNDGEQLAKQSNDAGLIW